MATKKVNFKRMSAEMVSKVSGYNNGYKRSCEISTKYRTLIKAKNDEKNAIIAKREEARKSGMKDSEIESKFSYVEIDNAIRALGIAKDDELKPYKDDIKVALALVSDDLYASYVYSKSGMNTSITVPKKGTTVAWGKKKDVFVTKSFKDALKDFADTLGIGRTDNDEAMKKFADVLSDRIGVQKSNDGEYLKVYNPNAFKNICLLAFLKVVTECGAFVETVDDNGEYTLTMSTAE